LKEWNLNIAGSPLYHYKKHHVMPVEIKKLIVKAVVDPSGTANEDVLQRGHVTTENNDQELLIKNCVRQVLQILKQTKQR
jgi:Family of unknown function (DUF5908)